MKVGCPGSALGEKELHSELGIPVGTELGFLGLPISHKLEINRLITEAQRATDIWENLPAPKVFVNVLWFKPCWKIRRVLARKSLCLKDSAQAADPVFWFEMVLLLAVKNFIKSA